MSKTGKKILKITGYLFIAACVVGIVMLTSFNTQMQKNRSCDEVHIAINHQNDLFFVDEADVKNMLIEQLGDSVKGELLAKIDVRRIEKLLGQNNYIERAETYLDANGELHIEIVQKQPLARVINKYGVNYYISDRGDKIPVSTKFTSRVAVISGNIEEGTQNLDTIKTQTLKNVHQLAQFIHANNFWNAQVEQIYVTTDKEIILVPKLGNHTIRMGSIENMEEKFHNLELFYKSGLNYVGWDQYETINVEFDGQIVCKKTQAYEQ